MKRILFLLHLPPPVHGSSVVGISIKKSTAINKEFECNYINLLASKHVSQSGTVNLRKLVGFVGTWLKVLSSISRKRPHLCYLALTSTGVAFYKDMLLIALLKIFGIKRVYHLHNKGVSLHQHKTLNRFCYNFVFKNAEVILLSQRLYSDVQTFLPESMVRICPNGIADKALISNAQSPVKSQPLVNILFLSNLIESKGVFVLLEACALLKGKGIPFDCLFIGGEGDVTSLQFTEFVNQLGLNDRVSYLGKKYGEEKNQAFTNADMFALPTYYSNECFPLVLLEAMSYSLPVISTFEGGIPDIVEDNITGFLVKQKDVVALAEKLEFMIQNPKIRHQMGTAGRKKYEMEFTINKFENKMTDILQEIIEKK